MCCQSLGYIHLGCRTIGQSEVPMVLHDFPYWQNRVTQGQQQGSESYTDTGMFDANRETAFVDLVELNQLEQVDEERFTVVHGVVIPTSLITLFGGERGGRVTGRFYNTTLFRMIC